MREISANLKKNYKGLKMNIQIGWKDKTKRTKSGMMKEMILKPEIKILAKDSKSRKEKIKREKKN